VSKKGMAGMLKESDYDVDFISLQETMRKHYPDSFFRKIDYGKKFAWHWISSKEKSGGILCGINIDRFDVISIMEGSFSIHAVVKDKKRKKDSLNSHSLWACP